MNELLRQLGDLVLGSVPTMLIFIVLVAAYTVLVYGPLKKTLAERRARTAGAVERANAAIAAAEAKAQEYEARLRAARLEIFARREKQLKEWNLAREESVTQAREEAHRRVVAARAALADELAAARTSMEGAIDRLADEIVGVILPAGSAADAAERAV